MSGWILDWSRDELEWELRMEQMRAAIGLKTRQEGLELPKFLVVAVAAVMGAAGALFGYSIGHH